MIKITIGIECRKIDASLLPFFAEVLSPKFPEAQVLSIFALEGRHMHRQTFLSDLNEIRRNTWNYVTVTKHMMSDGSGAYTHPLDPERKGMYVLDWFGDLYRGTGNPIYEMPITVKIKQVKPKEKKMLTRLYKLSRPEGNRAYYDEYAGAVVVAYSEDEARKIFPSETMELSLNWWQDDNKGTGWLPIKDVVVTEIGLAHPSLKPGTVVLESFNAS